MSATKRYYERLAEDVIKYADHYDLIDHTSYIDEVNFDNPRDVRFYAFRSAFEWLMEDPELICQLLRNAMENLRRKGELDGVDECYDIYKEIAFICYERARRNEGSIYRRND